MKKAYLRRTYQATLIISTTIIIEIIAPSLLYTFLKAIGVPTNASLLAAFITLGVLIILGLPFVPLPVHLLRGDVEAFKWRVPLRIKILLSRLFSIPIKLLHRFRFFTLLIFILGSILILLGISGFASQQQFMMNGQLATATVVGTTCANQSACIPIVQFKTQHDEPIISSTKCCATIYICVLGRCVPKLVAIGEGAVELKKGQIVSVIYNPNNPKEVQLQVQGSNQTSLAIQTVDFLTYGIIFIFIGLSCSLLFILLAIIRYLISNIKLDDVHPPKKQKKGPLFHQAISKEEIHSRKW